LVGNEVAELLYHDLLAEHEHVPAHSLLQSYRVLAQALFARHLQRYSGDLEELGYH
jgi:hypothetical protein